MPDIMRGLWKAGLHPPYKSGGGLIVWVCSPLSSQYFDALSRQADVRMPVKKDDAAPKRLTGFPPEPGCASLCVWLCNQRYGNGPAMRRRDVKMRMQPKYVRSANGMALCALAFAPFLTACAGHRETSAAVAARSPQAVSAAPAADAELSPFVPAGARQRLSARGDLDADGDDDALIVVESEGGAAGRAPRGLLILRRDASGMLRKALSSPKAVLCRECGGMMGDPLHSIRIAAGGFTLRFEGGSRELWSSEYRFVYDRAQDDWRLAEARIGGFDRADGSGAERTQTPAQFGEVRLSDFDAAEFSADALP